MTNAVRIAIIIYIILIVQGVITVTALYIKAKKNAVLYSLLVCHLMLILWLFFATIENLSIHTGFYLTALRISLLPIMYIPAALMIFVLFYVNIFTKKNRRLIFLVLLPNILCSWPLLTGKYLYLIIDEMIENHMVTKWGLLFFINLVVSNIYYLISSIIIIYKSLKDRVRLRQAILFLSAILIPASLNILTGTGAIKSPGFDIVPVSFSFVLVAISLLVFKYKTIDIVPLGYNELFNHINSAALIVDRQGSIDEYNSIFADYFNNLFNPHLCTSIYSFLDFINEYSDEKPNLDKIKKIIENENGPVYEDAFRVNSPDSSIKQYTISIVSLMSCKNNSVGKLIVIKDVTEYRSMTLSDERNRLSDDLHDSLGNCINSISSNLEYAIKNFDDSPQIKECIEISYEKSTSAFLHLRRIVDELRPIDIENNGLLWALRSMFYKLRIKGLDIEFSHNSINDKLISIKKHGEVIYFICQEAINNSVIHGRANNITVTLTQTKDQLKLYIADDGVGCSKIIKNKGLNSMKNRINILGGELSYGSPSEGGFNLKAVIPFTSSISDYKSEGV